MDKTEALARAADAVTVLALAIDSYGQHSPEAESAKTAARETFLVARAHGATDADLRATHRR